MRRPKLPSLVLFLVAFGSAPLALEADGAAPLALPGAEVASLARADDATAYRLALEWAALGRAEAAQRAYERVIAVAPDHPAARRALGFERVGGRWLAGDDLRRAKGFVQVGGRWVLAEEAPDLALARRRKAEAALRSTRSEVRTAAAQELARLADRRAVPPLVEAWARGEARAVTGYFAETRQRSYVQDFDVEVA